MLHLKIWIRNLCFQYWGHHQAFGTWHLARAYSCSCKWTKESALPATAERAIRECVVSSSPLSCPHSQGNRFFSCEEEAYFFLRNKNVFCLVSFRCQEDIWIEFCMDFWCEQECFLFSCLQFKHFRHRHKIFSDIISLSKMEQTHHSETTVHLRREMELELVSWEFW